MSEEISMMELSSREALSEMTVDSPSITLTNQTPPPNKPMEFPDTNELVIETEGSFTWKFENYSMAEKKQYSPAFQVGRFSWKILFYPRGNDPYEGISASLYLAIEPPEEETDWYCCAQVILSVEHLDGHGPLISKFTHHRFDPSEADWGFGSFCTIKSLEHGDQATNGYSIVGRDDSLLITARLRIIKDPTGILWHNFINYNSKKVTGFVGLANQGATCYMNSLLQSLYFTNAFRKAIFMIPTEGTAPVDNNALALQRIFWRLRHDDQPVSTNELTRAFGWETLESFIQSDVQEFSRVLLDELESKMKGTKAEGTIERLFVGKVRNVIRCLNVPFESSRTENFYDLQVPIKGVRTLEESFDNYVKAEMLENENKYAAEGYGLQDAKRFVEFEQFPPVLHLHLERYAFDPRVMATVKINDRLEFPLLIDLGKYLAADSPQRVQDQTFVLQSVFVHSGDSHGGHYYVFIRDLTENAGEGEGDRKWYKFDDTKVIPATEKEAVDDNFGGDLVVDEMGQDVSQMMTRSMTRSRESKDKYRKFTNAYMLVYIRKSDLVNVLCSINELTDIPAHIGEAIQIEDEAERKRRIEKQQALLTVKVHILTDEHLHGHGGFDLYNFDNRNMPSTQPIIHRVLRTEPLVELKKLVADEMNLPVEKVCFWTFYPRRNKTIRIDEPISGEDEQKPVSHFYSRLPVQQTHFVLYAEQISDGNMPNLKENICICFKFYDPEHSSLKFIGKFYVSPNAIIESIYPQLREAVGVPRNVQLEFYEEIKPGRIDPINLQKTFSENQLQTGDIICFQLANPILPQPAKLPKVVDYFRNLMESVHIQFRLASGEELISSRISLRTPFTELISAVAEKINALTTHVRLHVGDESGENPIPLKSAPTLHESLNSFLPDNAGTEGIVIWVEVTEIPVSELESMKRIRLMLLASNMSSATAAETTADECYLYISMKDTPITIYDRLPESFKTHLSPPIRLIEAHHNRIIRDYVEEDILTPLGETSSEIYIEGPISPLEINPPIGYKVISVFNYHREPSLTHSRPFRFLLIPGETFFLTRERILKRLGVSEVSWTFHLVSHGRARSINDKDVLASIVEGTEQLGINRPDPSLSVVKNAGIEKSIKIRSSTPAK